MGESGSAIECWPDAEAPGGKRGRPDSGKEVGGEVHSPRLDSSGLGPGLAQEQHTRKRSTAGVRPEIFAWHKLTLAPRRQTLLRA